MIYLIAGLVSRWISVLLLLAGVWQLGGGVWLLAKAELAQHLIERAWQQQLAVGENTTRQVKPWPWADTWPVARLQLANQKPLLVLDGTSGQALAFAPGMHPASGEPGNLNQPRTTVIAAHRDTHFRGLQQLQPGADIQLQDKYGRWHNYRVRDTRVVDSRVEQLPIRAEPDLLLVTCYPFAAIDPGGPLRYLVYAEYVGGGQMVNL